VHIFKSSKSNEADIRRTNNDQTSMSDFVCFSIEDSSKNLWNCCSTSFYRSNATSTNSINEPEV